MSTPSEHIPLKPGGNRLQSHPASPDDDLRLLSARVAPTLEDRLLRTVALFSPLILLLLWELAVRIHVLDARFFPAPSSIIDTLIQGIRSGEILDNIGATAWRVLVGYTMGAIPALSLGLTLALMPRARQILMPIFNTLYTVPKIAILPLLLFIFGVGDMSKFMIIAIGTFFLVFFNTINGVLQAPSIYFDVAHNSGASPIQICTTVALPAALPSIFTGLKLALGQSYVLIAATEFVGAKSGVGYYIWMSWQLFNVKQMFVGIILLSTMGYLSIMVLEKIQRVLIPYTRGGLQ